MPNHFSISRRSFLKMAGVSFVAMTFGTPSFKKVSAVTQAPQKVTTFRSTCAPECLHCNLTAYVIDGKVVGIGGTEGFPIKPCLRGLSRYQWLYHPDRLKTPLLRTGEKGEGKFKPISWDEALDLIVQKLNETKEKYGNKGILLQAQAGNLSALTRPFASAFFNFIGGCTTLSGSLCCGAVTGAMTPMLGFRYTEPRDTLKDSKYFLVWGNNPVVTLQGYFRYIEQAINNGARMVVIDPRFSETAAKADEWVSIVPGTDTALAMGMLDIIIKEKLYDKDFLLKHTSIPFLVDKKGDIVKLGGKPNAYAVLDAAGNVQPFENVAEPLLSAKGVSDEYDTVFDLIAAECAKWTPDKVEEETDVPAETVLRIAREYATIKPAMIIQNMSGAQRTEMGTYVAASQIYLAMFTGSYGTIGGGILDAGGVTQFMKVSPPIKSPKPPKMPTIPISIVGEYVSKDKPNPIGFWWQMTSGALTAQPNTNAMKRAMKKVPFVVVCDSLMTSSALYADLVLPVTTIFEDTNLMAGIRNHYVQLMEKAVEPPGEAKPDTWIFTELAKRMGFGEAFDKPIEEHIMACLAGSNITYEQLKKGPVKPVPTPWVPFKNGVFRTPTKRAMAFIQEWKDKYHLSPIVTYYRPVESPKGSPELAKKYPLMAIQRKLRRSVHSSFGTIPNVNELVYDKPHMMIHPEDAKERGIVNDEKVVVFNDRGKHPVIAIVTRFVRKGVVVLEDGWWEQQGGSSSHVTNDKPEPIGHGQSCNSTLVQVRKGV